MHDAEFRKITLVPCVHADHVKMKVLSQLHDGDNSNSNFDVLDVQTFDAIKKNSRMVNLLDLMVCLWNPLSRLRWTSFMAFFEFVVYFLHTT